MSSKLKKIIKTKADSVGLSMAGYLKYAALNWEAEMRVTEVIKKEVERVMREKKHGKRRTKQSNRKG